MNPLSLLSMLAGWTPDGGQVPLFPCFLHGNTTSAIPFKYAARQKQDFEFGCADGPGPASSQQ